MVGGSSPSGRNLCSEVVSIRSGIFFTTPAMVFGLHETGFALGPPPVVSSL
jgi:hypothetical protein